METTMKTYEYDWKVAAIHKLRVNIKSLAAEARIIRQESRRAGYPYSGILTEHRRGKLREEARYSHLALGYVRGRSYASMEGSKRLERCKPSADQKVLMTKLSGFLPYMHGLKSEDLRQWIMAE